MIMHQCVKEFEEHLKFNEKSEWTIKGYVKEMNYFNNYLEVQNNGPVYAEDVTKEDVRNYLNYIREKGYKPNSRNRVLFIFRSFYNFTQAENITEKHLAKDLKPLKTRKKERVYLTEKEFTTLAKKIDHTIVKAAVQTMYYTGLRVSECFNLTFDDLDMENKIIHVKQGKGNKDRDIPISDTLLDILTDYLEEKRPKVASDYIFATRRSGELSGAFLNRKIKEAVNVL